MFSTGEHSANFGTSWAEADPTKFLSRPSFLG
ncbi:MAG: hypothetical protein RL391_789 [Actinomycetota bacterium]|jgi:hypothetical protein